MPALEQREFDLWREHHDRKVDRILDHLEAQGTITLDVEGRLSTVEVNQEHSASGLAKRTTYISSIVAAIVGGAAAWFAGSVKP